jgi:hypothetical protein
MPVINRTPRVQSRLHRIPSAVEYLNGVISEKTLRQWVWRRRIPVVRIGGAVCIAEDVLDGLREDVPAEEFMKGTRKSPPSS